MMKREDLLLRIREVDRQMDDIIAKNPATQVAYKAVRFPLVPLILTAVLVGSWNYGQGTVPVPPDLWDWQLYIGGFFGLISLLMLVRWIGFRGKAGNKAYREANARLVELRKQKAILQGQLQELPD